MSNDEMVLDAALTGGEEQNFDINADLIRGHINTIILRSLYDGDKYGYDIINEIEKKSGGMYSLKQPTLYSALKRLESNNYVTSYLGDSSHGGRRKYFSLTNQGKAFTEKNLAEWEYSRTIIDSLISDGNAHYDFSFITDKQNELTQLKQALAAREQALEDEKIALNNLRNELQRERSLLQTQSASLSSQKSDFTELRDRVEAQAAELEEKRRVLSEKQGVIDAKELELAEKQLEIGNAKADLERQNAEILHLKDLLESQKKAFEKQELSISSLQEENEELIALNQSLSARQANTEELNALQAELTATQQELENKNAVITSLNAAINTHENTIALLKNDFENKNTEYYNRLIEMQSLQSQLDAQRERIDNDKALIDAKSAETQQLRAQLEAREQELVERENALREQLNDIQNQQTLHSTTLTDLESERSELQNQLQILEVERNTLRADNEALEEARAKLEDERNALNALRDSLQAERIQIEKRTFELTQQELSIEDQQRALANKQSQTSASTEEAQRLLDNIQEREAALLENTRKLQEAIANLQQQQRDYTAKQELYTKQNLELFTNKSAFSAQQYEFAQKMADYNAQVELYNKNLEQLNADKTTFEADKLRFEENLKDFETKKAAFDEELAKFEAIKQEYNQKLLDLQKKSMEDDSGMRMRMEELNAREYALSQRENALMKQMNDFYNRIQNEPTPAPAATPAQPANPSPSPFASPLFPQEQPTYAQQPAAMPLTERAQLDGIRLYTTGNARPATAQQNDEKTTTPKKNGKGVYNIGATLFKTALIIFCIIAFESVCVYFAKDYLGVSVLYPVIGLALGAITFIVCAILYACAFKPNAKRKKTAPYIATACIFFVISIIAVTMIAVYFKAQLSIPAQLLKFVVIPVAYLLNMVLFAIFYRSLSLNEPKN